MAYPTQIEADLTLRGIDIGAWHRGDKHPDGRPVLSSRLFINITDGLLPSEHSWFKLAVYKDVEEEKARVEKAAQDGARSKVMAGLYRKVPQHLRKAV